MKDTFFAGATAYLSSRDESSKTGVTEDVAHQIAIAVAKPLMPPGDYKFSLKKISKNGDVEWFPSWRPDGFTPPAIKPGDEYEMKPEHGIIYAVEYGDFIELASSQES